MVRINGKIEWNYVIIFTIAITLFLLIGLPYLDHLVITHGLIPAFIVFLVMYSAMAYILGLVVHEGVKGIILFVSGFIALDTWLPPIIVPMSGPTVLEPVQSISADLFFYTIVSQYLPHIAAWWVTYLVIPMIFLIICLYYFTGKDVLRMFG